MDETQLEMRVAWDIEAGQELIQADLAGAEDELVQVVLIELVEPLLLPARHCVLGVLCTAGPDRIPDSMREHRLDDEQWQRLICHRRRLSGLGVDVGHRRLTASIDRPLDRVAGAPALLLKPFWREHEQQVIAVGIFFDVQGQCGHFRAPVEALDPGLAVEKGMI